MYDFNLQRMYAYKIYMRDPINILRTDTNCEDCTFIYNTEGRDIYENN